jgi:type II secretory pathway component PulK
MRSKSSGYVTIIVIWVAAALFVISGGLTLYIRNQARALKNYQSYMKSYYIAYAGAFDVIFSDYANGIVLGLSRLDKIENFNAKNASVSFGGGTYTAVLEEEGGKANINSASLNVIKDVLVGIKMSDAEKKAQAIFSWRKQNGGLFFNAEELGLVPELEVNDVFSLLSYFTIYSDGALNVNTASQEVLKAYISDFAGPAALADKLIKKRPFGEELQDYLRQNAPGMPGRFRRYFGIVSAVKRVKVTGSADGKSLVKINAVFNVLQKEGHESIFLKYFWQE